MNKIIKKLFSLPKAKLIPILVVGVLVAGFAVAATVPYLSNLVENIFGVSSPTELRLYDPDKNLMPDDGEAKAGDTIRFSKIVENSSNNAIPMAIALVVKDVNMDNKTGVGDDVWPELEVTSAGPCGGTGYTDKCVYYAGGDAGLPYNWDSPCWCQNEGDTWYLHGGCSGTYEDTMVVTENGIPYSVILFGGTFEGTGRNAKVIKTGYGTVPLHNGGNAEQTCVEKSGLTMIAAGGYDTGKVKVTLAPNLEPDKDYYFRTQVVMPGSTIAEVLKAMGWQDW